MSLRNEIGAATYDRLKKAIHNYAPDCRAPSEDEVDALIRWMREQYEDDFAALGIHRPSQTSSALAAPTPSGHTVYFVKAKHERKGPGAHAFLGKVPMVRVALPFDGSVEIDTKIGAVLGKDHRLPSCAAVHRQYPDQLNQAPERVELITPARIHGALFGAIALYLGYSKKEDVKPSFYVVEAGTAMGDTVRLFPGWNFSDFIDSTSFYKPTPFADPSNRYRARLYLQDDAPNEPRQLHIEVQGTYSVEITADFEKSDFRRDSAGIIFEALVRVSSIARALGQRPFGPITDILAKLGDKREWIEKPSRG